MPLELRGFLNGPITVAMLDEGGALRARLADGSYLSVGSRTRGAIQNVTTGAALFGSTILSGTVFVQRNAAAAIAFGAPLFSGAVIRGLSAAAATNLPALEVAGVAKRTVIVAGATTFGALTAAAAPVRQVEAVGDATLPGLAAAGTATVGDEVTGDVSLPAAEFEGTATVQRQAAGAAVLPAAAVAGVAKRTVVVQGAVQFGAMQAAGAGARSVLGAGDVSFAALSAAGAAERGVTAAGASTFPAMTAAGTPGPKYLLQNFGQNVTAGSGYVEVTYEVSTSAETDEAHLFAEIHDTTTYPGRGNGTFLSLDLGAVDDSVPAIMDLRDLHGEDVVIHLTVGDPGDSDSINGTAFTVPSSVPAAFGTGQWTIADLGTEGDARITITELPDDYGSAFTDFEVQVDGGGWASLGGTSTGTYDVAGFTDDVEADVAIRAVNGIGNGTASATKPVTTTSGSIVPFSDDFNGSINGGWTFAPNTASTKTAPSTSNNDDSTDFWLEILIPADGGAAGSYDPTNGLDTVPTLLQPVEDGDIDISMGLNVWPPDGTGGSTGYHAAFLVIANTDFSRFVIVGKTCNNNGDVRTRAFSVEDGVGYTQETNTSSSTDHVRMVFDEGTGVTTVYHGNDGSTWGSSVDTISFDLVPAYVGICLENGSNGTSGFTAEIDYFKISTDDINDVEGGEPA